MRETRRRESDGLVTLLWARACNRHDNLHKTFEVAIVAVMSLNAERYVAFAATSRIWKCSELREQLQRCRFMFNISIIL